MIDFSENIDFNAIIDDVFDSAMFQLSDIMPSEWAEKNRVMTSEVSNRKGPFSFKNSPYTIGLIDLLHSSHPCRVLVVEKGAQIGFSTSFIENGIGYIISEDPGNILFLVGHDSLVETAMNKVDNMLSTTGLRDSGIIRSNANRIKNNKSGDKDRSKEFAGGRLKLGPTNHESLRQESYKYGFIDDFESMPKESKKDGATVPLIFQRFASYKESMKLCFISTPRLMATSNIHPEYLLGDQRKYHIPCPCCGELITLEWETECLIDSIDRAGIVWQTDENGELIEESVGYICQRCGGFFDESKKDEFLLPVQLGGKADWIPTAKPKDSRYVSVQISALYAMSYMFGWVEYVKQWTTRVMLPNGDIDERELQTFTNLVLGEPYKGNTTSTSAKKIQSNIRQYEVGTIPDKLSEQDGNGSIVLLTIGADLNGKEDDARIDWEIVAWSESGSSYSIDQGSVGTFIPGESSLPNELKKDRKKWTYRMGLEIENSVWPILDEIANRVYIRDSNGKQEQIHAGCLDTGYFTTEYAYPYIENSEFPWFGIKGDKAQDLGIQENADYRPFNISKERSDLWILNVNLYKDHLSTSMNKTWAEQLKAKQPGGFMNFPLPTAGKYLFGSYFEHFEGEHKIAENGRFVWKKKSPKHQNHFWDCRIYNMAAKDIFTHVFFKSMKMQNGTFADFVRIIKNQ